jgi:transglutaminase-like putative cysteine protease
MSFAMLHKLVAYLIAGLGLIGLSLGGELSTPVLIVGALAFVGSYFAEGDFVRSDRYSSAWTGAVVLLLVLQLARVITDTFTLPIMLEFAGFLQISRLFNRRTAVDYQQIAVIAFLHLIAATALSTSLIYAAVFFGFVIATPWMLALSHLRREIEGNYPSSGQGDEAAAAAIRRVLASKRVVGPGFLVGTALLTLPLFVMTLAIFFMVPRVGKGFLSLQRDPGRKVAGFSSSVELGGFGLIRDDPTVVLRVIPLPEHPDPPPSLALRLRGTSFDRYDGRTWHRTPAPIRRVRRSSGQYPLVRWPDERLDRSMRLVLDHLDETVVFVPEHTIALGIAPRYINGSEVGRHVAQHGSDELRYADDDELGLVYTAYVSADPLETSEPGLTREQLAPFLQLPDGHTRLIELARRLTANTTSDAQRVNVLLRYLQSGAYKYTLDQPDVGNSTPLDAFLFVTKRGHCEYFASALAIMARAVGIPSRNVTGFIGGTYNSYGRYYAIKQGDAHSWVEVFLEGRGWVTADPTPSGALAARGSNLITTMRELIDAMRTRWLTSVIAYDLRTQINTLRDLAHWASQFRDRGDSPIRESEDERVGGDIPWRTVSLWVLGLGAIAVIVTLGRRRNTIKSRALSVDEQAVVQLYRELERALEHRGCPRPASLTPTEHARNLQRAGFPEHEPVSAITQRYVQVRFGAATLRKEELATLKASISKIKNGPVFKQAA